MSKKSKFLIIFLAAVIILSLCAGLLLPNNSIVPGKKKAAFGGVSALNNISLIHPNYSGQSAYIGDGYRLFNDYTPPGEVHLSYSGVNYYNVIDDSEKDNHDYLIVDFDLHMQNYDSKLTPYLQFYNGNNVGTRERLKITNKGDNILIEKLEKSTVLRDIVVEGNDVHLTYVYDFTTQGKSTILTYINGKYFCKLNPYGDKGVYCYLRFRFHVFENDYIQSDGFADVTNFTAYSFKNGYNGAIAELFKDHSINLKDCTDSILFERE